MPLEVLGGRRRGDGDFRLLMLLLLPLLVIMTVAVVLLLFCDVDDDVATLLSLLGLELLNSLLWSDMLEFADSTKPKETRLESFRATSSQSRSCNPTSLGHALRRSVSIYLIEHSLARKHKLS